jgi:hypothetical protein
MARVMLEATTGFEPVIRVLQFWKNRSPTFTGVRRRRFVPTNVRDHSSLAAAIRLLGYIRGYPGISHRRTLSTLTANAHHR